MQAASAVRWQPCAIPFPRKDSFVGSSSSTALIPSLRLRALPRRELPP